ncbi:hypothetical protein E2C01_053374 [Portunus trituberculatus]|uniref:Secreted protein n=1 Tax=Portunus trituberculatus TaxID=210409 RepID=A0A5B7GP99_PORTR|nr:hypothetical protein [Portunus trituberculatus]
MPEVHLGVSRLALQFSLCCIIYVSPAANSRLCDVLLRDTGPAKFMKAATSFQIPASRRSCLCSCSVNCLALNCSNVRY